MPSCSYCGAQMILVKAGRGGMGGPGNRYRCPNKPHKRCPKCNRVLDMRPPFRGQCDYCGYKITP